MKERLTKGEADVSEINISPLIDMVFILLIFFIVTTVFVEESGLAVNTPEPLPLPPTELSEPFVLRVSKAGGVFYKGDEVGLQGIAGCIQNAKAMGTLDSITIAVHKQASMASTARVLGFCYAETRVKIVMKAAQELP